MKKVKSYVKKMSNLIPAIASLSSIVFLFDFIGKLRVGDPT